MIGRLFAKIRMVKDVQNRKEKATLSVAVLQIYNIYKNNIFEIHLVSLQIYERKEM
jgi:hypothetical protein